MFSFTKRADYALLALCYLTAAGDGGRGRLVNSKEIAEHYNIPIELLAKIMQVLARHQLVSSSPGPTGGYRLTRDPADVSVAMIVKIIDGQVGMIHCSNGNDSGCEQFERCTIRNPLTTIEERMYELLEKMSIREISQPQGQSEPSNVIPLGSLLR
ncbi:MAG: Rrf2 family transcriptional regulator [Capsulimonadaceae bacterium]|nr:Rrf2 family transcriptional regulator [Capsulimonadaceae bacterium]